MKAPDKIYIRPQTNPNMLGGLWSGKPTKEATVPYIRKDTLIEWVKQKQYESLTIVADNFWQEVIDKINEI